MRFPFKIYHSDSRGVESNCVYSHEASISDEAGLAAATQFDYVTAAYKNNYRSKDNFIRSDCLAMDCDNDFTEDPEQWITPEKLQELLPDVAFAVQYSRNNGKSKRGKAPRPKFHLLFPIPEVTDPQAYAALKNQLQQTFSFFDSQALDAARFFYGTANPEVQLIDGTETIADFLDENAFAALPEREEAIPEGSRNSTLSRFAGRVLKRCGVSEEAKKAFLDEAAKCNPPLSESELDHIWRSAIRFYQRIKQQDGYIQPEDYAKECTYLPEDFTDVGQARVLARVSAGELRYSPATDYIVYNGTHWEESKHGAQAVVQKLTDNQLTEADTMAKRASKELADTGATEVLARESKKKAEALFNENQAKAFKLFVKSQEYKKFALDRRKSRSIADTLKEARPLLAIRPQDLDADGTLLCTPAGTYDLRFGMAGLREHRPEDFTTKITAVSPSTDGHDLWEQQLKLLFCDDQELIDYVQLVAGTACIGRVFIEQLIIAYGSGANGKSTFWNTLARIMGTYSGNLSADTLTMGNHRNVKPEMAELKGKRLVIASELEEGTRLNTATVKQLSSTDDVYAEKKYKDPFSFTPSHTLVLYTNHLPRVGAIDAGTWRRLIVVPFNAHIDSTQDVKNYAEYLYQNAGGAALAWMIEGARKVIEMGFKIKLPEVVVRAVAKYREENDWLGHFIEDCCEVGKGKSVASGELYIRYRNYCTENGEFIRSTAEFYAAMDNAGFTRKRTNKVRLLIGIGLKAQEFITESSENLEFLS